jgi:hypothetical protein
VSDALEPHRVDMRAVVAVPDGSQERHHNRIGAEGTPCEALGSVRRQPWAHTPWGWVRQ